MIDQITEHTMTFIYLGIITWICGWISGTCITISSNRMERIVKSVTHSLLVKYTIDSTVKDKSYPSNIF